MHHYSCSASNIHPNVSTPLENILRVTLFALMHMVLTLNCKLLPQYKIPSRLKAFKDIALLYFYFCLPTSFHVFMKL